MTSIAALHVQVVGATQFLPPEIDGAPWVTDADGGQALAEFAGRACYESFARNRAETATNETFLRHVLEVGHLSVLEHGSASLYLTGVSRSLTHELVRHRHFSYSQLSQRQTPSGAAVEPAVVAADPELHALFVAATDAALTAYDALLEGIRARLPSGTLRSKQAHQAAVSVLPVATETRIVVTGNYRAWRHFIGMRGSDHVDVEVRGLAVACLEALQQVAPNVFADFTTRTEKDGTRVASSPLVAEG